MNQSKNKHARMFARTAKGRWTSACLSAVLVLAAACGDDDSDDGSPSDPKPTVDSGTADASTTTPDAATPAPADAGQTTPDAAAPTPDAGGGDGGDAGTGTGGGNTAAIMRGKALADENVCTSCHRNTYEGAAFYPNITPDMATGIGTWTDDEIKDAISMGVGKGNDELCSLMMRYEFSDSELDDLVAFLRSLAPVSKKITAACTAN